ncbi:uncharacterized protein B0H18DRAFT_1125734 [Fomitopsis serialis]|uniref:uncharacterized protein n=1 Tax=Fomitopsis serialis TaxID=139415 RepID=UPI00200761B0|nr:uncharacterized protein B0H18DRAFT_1125734 [Neoantrodia serialis]KAH9914257.1 hypothetical protein B0H18DRAFT_1125734 [Neoantrodia serialis]
MGMIGGYILPESSVHDFWAKRWGEQHLEDTPADEEPGVYDDVSHDIVYLIEWVRSLPATHRVAPVSWLLGKHGETAVIITAWEDQKRHFRRILEDKAQEELRDTFVQAANEAAGHDVFALKDLQYFSMSEQYLVLPLAMCYDRPRAAHEVPVNSAPQNVRAPALPVMCRGTAE